VAADHDEGRLGGAADGCEEDDGARPTQVERGAAKGLSRFARVRRSCRREKSKRGHGTTVNSADGARRHDGGRVEKEKKTATRGFNSWGEASRACQQQLAKQQAGSCVPSARKRPEERRRHRRSSSMANRVWSDYCSNTTSFLFLPNLHSNLKISKNESCSPFQDLQLCFWNHLQILPGF
jgi:hypothetical protein